MGLGELPLNMSLRDGTPIAISRLGPEGRTGLTAFYASLPEVDRMVLKDDVTTQDWADRFLRKVAEGEVVSILARTGTQVIAEGSLYRCLHGWMRHVGEIRVTVQPARRRQGLGLALAGLLVRIATDFGIEKLVAQMTEAQAGSRRTFEKLGFHPEAILPATSRIWVARNGISSSWPAMSPRSGPPWTPWFRTTIRTQKDEGEGARQNCGDAAKCSKKACNRSRPWRGRLLP